jgi:hypothetical protein
MNDPITHRMDVAIERGRWRFPKSPPSRFYLDSEDWRQFDEEMRADWPSAAHTFSYQDIQIHPATRSRLALKGGCLVCVPKHVSPRTKAAA